MKRFFILFVFSSLLFSACRKQVPGDVINPPDTDLPGLRVWVANEGSLGNGNASLSMIHPDDDSIYNNLYKSANNQDLGDVFQSMIRIHDELFLAINNSDVIKVIDPNTFLLKKEIQVRKPRYMLPLAENKMYVTSLFYPEINIVDPITGELTGKITTDYPNTEGLLLFNQKVYVCNWDTACNFLYEIDPASNQITHRIPIGGFAPQQVLADKNGKLWVLAGNIDKGVSSTLTQIDPTTRTILKTLHFQGNSDIMKPTWNRSKDTLYYLGVDYNGGTTYNGLFRISINASNPPTAPLIAAQSLQYFWGLGIDTAGQRIYLGDPKGFIQRGDVNVYDLNGELKQTYKAQLGPGFFLFDYGQ